MAINGRKIREQVLPLLARKDYRPLDKIEIARKLGLSPSEGVALRKTLRELERGGQIARIRKNRYVLPAEADLVAGKLSIHQAGYGFLTPETPGEPDTFIAAENIGTAMHGDRVVARISRDEPYSRIKGRREGRVIRILERAHDTIVGTLQRSRNFYYVVPDDPRVFDDAIQVEKTNTGWRLGVHIADVAGYVEPGSALDREARRRGNSVYLPDRVIPMLPERLSNGVCSLNPGVDRLTHSVFIEFDKNGRAKNARFAKSVIRSAKRLTYKEAYAILKTKPSGELSRRLHTAWELASLLRRKRFEQGSLDLDFPEVKVYLDPAGKPIRLERVENDESHQLIEEFMLAANEAVARELRQRSIATIYRVHEDPDPEKLAEYREFVLSFNHKVGDLSHRKEVQRFLASIRGKPEEQALKIGLLKSLKRARYAAQSLGHYGLAKANYLHFTSPIRRYADLVVHRTLAERNSPRRSKIDVGQIESLANHISDTERKAAEAAIESVRLKKLQFFQEQLEQRNPQVFRAAIMDVRNYGLVVELPDALVTGVVHVSTLGDDFYIFDAAQRRLIGRRTRRRFSVGDEIRVFVARVDAFKRQIDFAIADQVSRKSPRRR